MKLKRKPDMHGRPSLSNGGRGSKVHVDKEDATRTGLVPPCIFPSLMVVVRAFQDFKGWFKITNYTNNYA